MRVTSKLMKFKSMFIQQQFNDIKVDIELRVVLFKPTEQIYQVNLFIINKSTGKYNVMNGNVETFHSAELAEQCFLQQCEKLKGCDIYESEDIFS